MKRTLYKITQMDCPSEEQLIRMKLCNVKGINYLDFDIPGRQLFVYHTAEIQTLTEALDSLDLGSTYIDSQLADGDTEALGFDTKSQKKLLWTVLGINFLFFILEIVTGFLANSMGLVADSLDMLADSIVYGLALYAVGHSLAAKANVAKISGYFQLALALLGLIEVVRRFAGYGEVPVYSTMIIVSAFALIGNGLCLYLLQKSKSKEAHMQASMIFTSNDVIVNLGVILAGVLVFFTTSKLPDLIIGICVFIIVGKGALKILKLK